MSDLFWMTDEQMARLRPFFPRSHGRPRVDDRRVLSRVIFFNRNGLRWRAPAEYGPPKTLYNRWKRWSEIGAVGYTCQKHLTETSPVTEVLNLDELDAARAALLMLSGQKAPERLACFLLALLRRQRDRSDGLGRRTLLQVPIGRQALANYLDTQPETLSRAFHALADEGAIGLLGGRRVEVVDSGILVDLMGMEPEELLGQERNTPRGKTPGRRDRPGRH